MISLYSGMECMDIIKGHLSYPKLCCILSFGLFSGAWTSCADVSEHSFSAIFIGVVSSKNDWDEIATVFIQVQVWLKVAWAIKFRRRGITQKKEYNIQNIAIVWNQQYYVPDQKAIVDEV
jgi:hypothetical protein